MYSILAIMTDDPHFLAYRLKDDIDAEIWLTVADLTICLTQTEAETVISELTRELREVEALAHGVTA